MWKWLSTGIAFFIAGVTLVATGHIGWGIFCFAVASILFIFAWVFSRQNVKVTNIHCVILEDTTMSDGYNPIAVSGFVKIRRRDEITDCKLMIASSTKEYNQEGIELREKIDGANSFVFKIPVGYEDTGELFDWGLIYTKVGEWIWHTTPFQIRTQGQSNERQVKEMDKSETLKTQKRRDEGKITKKQLREIIDKASHPVKKSEKGKS